MVDYFRTGHDGKKVKSRTATHHAKAPVGVSSRCRQVEHQDKVGTDGWWQSHMVRLPGKEATDVSHVYQRAANHAKAATVVL